MPVDQARTRLPELYADEMARREDDFRAKLTDALRLVDTFLKDPLLAERQAMGKWGVDEGKSYISAIRGSKSVEHAFAVRLIAFHDELWGHALSVLIGKDGSTPADPSAVAGRIEGATTRDAEAALFEIEGTCLGKLSSDVPRGVGAHLLGEVDRRIEVEPLQSEVKKVLLGSLPDPPPPPPPEAVEKAEAARRAADAAAAAADGDGESADEAVDGGAEARLHRPRPATATQARPS